jgi:hypothetical protein
VLEDYILKRELTETGGLGRYEKDGRSIKGMTYFRHGGESPLPSAMDSLDYRRWISYHAA